MKLMLMMLLAFVEPEMSSKKASFDGKVVILEEKVELDHPFGKLKTEKATLEKGSSDKLSFEKALLEQGVEVMLMSGACLKGQSAQASLEEKKLAFSGDVSYQEPLGLKLFAQTAEAEFEEKEGKFQITAMRAKQQAKALFPEGKVVLCEEAFYQPEKVFEIKGSLKQPCQLDDQDLHIQSQTGRFDLLEEKGFLTQVKADLKLHVGGVKTPIRIQAEELIFAEKTGVIESNKRTQVESEAYRMQSDLTQFKIKLGPKRQVEEALLIGEMKIQGEGNEELECHGVLKLHEGKQQMILKAAPGESIIYRSQDLVMRASRARLHFKQGEGKYHLMKIELEDDVQVFDLRAKKNIYGKASLAHVFVDQERVHLYGEGDQRVLYVDETIDLHLSAPEVVVHKTESGKLSVQGIGAVRFSFSDEERLFLEKLKLKNS